MEHEESLKRDQQDIAGRQTATGAAVAGTQAAETAMEAGKQAAKEAIAAGRTGGAGQAGIVPGFPGPGIDKEKAAKAPTAAGIAQQKPRSIRERVSTIFASMRKEQENPASEIIVEELDYIDIIFGGSSLYEGLQFIEVENSKGESILVGTWIKRDDGFWALRLTDLGFDKG